MLKDVVEVRALGAYRLWVMFEDGVNGEIDMKDYLSFRGVFEPLKDVKFFAQVAVDPECGVLCWPGNVDIDPDVLYARISGQPIVINEPQDDAHV